MLTRVYTMILSSLICLVISIVHHRYAEAIAWLCCIFANIALILSERRRIRESNQLEAEQCNVTYLRSRLRSAECNQMKIKCDNERLLEQIDDIGFRMVDLRTRLLNEFEERVQAQKCTLAMENAFEEQNKKLQDAQTLNEYLGRVVNNMDKVISLDTKLINSLRKTNDLQAKEIEQLTGHLW